MSATANILHADLDAFYAAVEQMIDPSLRGRPIAVGGGVVLAASYEAKAFGVRGGMPGRQAREICADLLFVPGNFGEYRRLGDAAVDIIASYTPLIERISIDEAFADVSGCEKLFGSPTEIARSIRHRVKCELGLPISIGIAGTKHLAKIASQVAKPDGLVIVPTQQEPEFLHNLPVELMWGVGPVTKTRLAEAGISTIGELCKQSATHLERLLGEAAGAKLSALARNRDPRRVILRRRARSVGSQSALGTRSIDPNVIKPNIRQIADRVASRLRAKGRSGRTITIRVRFSDLRSVTRSSTLPYAVSATGILAEVATELVGTALSDHPEESFISLLAIAVSNLEDDGIMQFDLPLLLQDECRRPGSEKGAARRKADCAMDSIRDRYGRDAVAYGSSYFGASRSVPDEFRALQTSSA